MALARRNRPFPQPISRTTGACRPKIAAKSSGPSVGKRLMPVFVQRWGGRIRPGIGTPNSYSRSPRRSSLRIQCLPLPFSSPRPLELVRGQNLSNAPIITGSRQTLAWGTNFRPRALRNILYLQACSSVSDHYKWYDRPLGYGWCPLKKIGEVLDV